MPITVGEWSTRSDRCCSIARQRRPPPGRLRSTDACRPAPKSTWSSTSLSVATRELPEAADRAPGHRTRHFKPTPGENVVVLSPGLPLRVGFSAQGLLADGTWRAGLSVGLVSDRPAIDDGASENRCPESIVRRESLDPAALAVDSVGTILPGGEVCFLANSASRNWPPFGRRCASGNADAPHRGSRDRKWLPDCRDREPVRSFSPC